MGILQKPNVLTLLFNRLQNKNVLYNQIQTLFCYEEQSMINKAHEVFIPEIILPAQRRGPRNEHGS